MHPCLVASYDKPRGLKAADKFFVPLPAGGKQPIRTYGAPINPYGPVVSAYPRGPQESALSGVRESPSNGRRVPYRGLIAPLAKGVPRYELQLYEAVFLRRCYNRATVVVIGLLRTSSHIPITVI